jgi:hypothetical protein
MDERAARGMPTEYIRGYRREMVEKAVREARLAYKFNPSSYTFEVLNAVLALEVLERGREGEIT